MEDKMQSRGKTANPLAMLRVLSLAFAFAIILITLAGPYQSDGAQYGRSTPIYEPDRYGVEINDDDCDEHPDDEPPVEIEDDIGEATAGSDDYGPMDPAQLEINYESDENAEDTVSKEAIETNIVPCPNAKDPTCKFRDSCGRAPLNRLKNAAKGGSRRGQISPYTINGDRVETYGEWPSFVRLEKFSRKPPRGMEVCGGVLISDRHVLTAGYCAYWHEGKDLAKPEHFIAYLADHKANSNDTFEDEFDVKRICRSKRYAYSDDSKTDDWAIFELDQPVEKFNDHIQPACLPFEPIKRTGKSAQCWTMGYGLISQRRPDREESLWMHKMRVEQVSCRGFGLNDRDRSRECYAKAKRHQGTGCYEDWGNPVLCMDEKGRWTVTGVMSYFDDDPNYTCSGKGPAAWKTVFARVRTLLSDIKKECNI